MPQHGAAELAHGLHLQQAHHTSGDGKGLFRHRGVPSPGGRDGKEASLYSTLLLIYLAQAVLYSMSKFT